MRIVRIVKILVTLGCVLLLASCGPVCSLHPLYTGTELVSEPALVGTWAEGESDTGKWIFEKSAENVYKLTNKDGDKTKFESEVHLVRLGKFTFLDASFFPDASFKEQEFKGVFLLPVHYFARIRIEGDVLRLAIFADGSLPEAFVEKRLRHLELGGATVLTVSTRELQRFVLKHAEDERAFSDESRLLREK